MTALGSEHDGADDGGDRVFVLRFWRESGASAAEPAQWRARVTGPERAAARYAASVDEALALVRQDMRGGCDAASD